MNLKQALVVAIAGLAFLATGAVAVAQPVTPPSNLPADPWPRDVSIANAAVLVYQPQINSWVGNQIDMRMATALKPSGATQETFGTATATARTQVDRATRTVVFQNLQLTRVDFPTLPERGAGYTAALQAALARQMQTISLDRLEASLAAAGIKPTPVEVQNQPPQVVVSYTPAILVPVDGAPVWKPVPGDSRFQRVVNTHALILKGGLGDQLYLHVYDGWLSAATLDGPWTQSNLQPLGMDDVARKLAQAGTVDLLNGGPKASPKPSLANGVPSVVVSQVPTELIVFTGQPNFVPINGTQLLWASNTTGDVFIETANNDYYVLMSGRWFRAPALGGPWSFVPANALPADFARIPPASLAGAVLPTVAGTPQAQEALISNSIPQTATVPLKNSPKFTPSFDGPPEYAPIPGTALTYVANSAVPLIRVNADAYYAVSAGVWFSAHSLTGPWNVATSVPPAIYTIPASSPLHYVTYVRIYEATPTAVYVGYTPGYMGTVVSPYGTVVYGTGYAYTPWIGNVWYAPPYTYSVAAAPVYNPYVGFTYGFAVGLASAAWVTPYWGAYYHPYYWGGYGCCATASSNVYGHWGNTVYSGTRSWYAGGGVAGSSAWGSYSNARTGVSGNYSAGRQYNAWTGNATRAYDRSGTGPDGGSGNVTRAGNYNVYSGQRSTANSASLSGPGGSSFDRSGATTAGPQGFAHAGGGSTYNAATGKTNTWNTASLGNNHVADVNGNVYRNSGDGWQRYGGGGWSAAGGDTSWADRESQARSTGADRFGGYGGFGGGGFGGDRFGGGGFGGDRFGGGGFGGRFGGGGFGGRRAGGFRR
jgi:hypothetical protein